MANVIATKTVTGTHALTGKALTYKVDAVHNPESLLEGRWTVVINGKTSRWYAMESAALRCVRKAIVGMYGISFGEAF